MMNKIYYNPQTFFLMIIFAMILQSKLLAQESINYKPSEVRWNKSQHENSNNSKDFLKTIRSKKEFYQQTGKRGKEFLPKPNNDIIYVIAHRGVHNGIPENTIASYKKAIELGCDFI